MRQQASCTRPGDVTAQRRGEPVRFAAPDHVVLGGFIWSHSLSDPRHPVVVISPATSVRCRYYSRFADYLYANGFNVLIYDYRGIGESRPSSLRGFQADWVDWGEKDLEAALRLAQAEFPGHPIHAVGHSIGGFAIGLATSNHLIGRIFTVGAQYAYWRDYDSSHRRRMYLKWHILMPIMTGLFGYFPARRLGWMEDTPAGVVRDWSRMKARFEDTLRHDMFVGGVRESEQLRRRFTTVTAPILAVGLTDDTNGTPAALCSSGLRAGLGMPPIVGTIGCTAVCALRIGRPRSPGSGGPSFGIPA